MHVLPMLVSTERKMNSRNINTLDSRDSLQVSLDYWTHSNMFLLDELDLPGNSLYFLLLYKFANWKINKNI
jgi:hypothetical protein